MTMDMAFKVGQIVAWLVVGVVFYFNTQAGTTEDLSTLGVRLSVAETQLHQEMRGYEILQANIGRRLEAIETKVDCLIDRRLCRHD